MRNIFTRLIPFISFGIILVLFIVGFVLLSYLLIAGAVIGLVLFIIAWFKEKLFPTKHVIKRQPPSDDRPGRTIDHE